MYICRYKISGGSIFKMEEEKMKKKKGHDSALVRSLKRTFQTLKSKIEGHNRHTMDEISKDAFLGYEIDTDLHTMQDDEEIE
jgi:hypothetical protein